MMSNSVSIGDKLTSLQRPPNEWGADGFIHDHVFSNDEGIQSVLDPLSRNNSKNGFGIVIGAVGPLLSYMQHRNESAFVLVDINPKVTLASIGILGLAKGASKYRDIEESLPAFFDKNNLNPQRFHEEKKIFGEHHWLREDSFESVKKRLGSTSITPVSADLLNPRFLHDLNEQRGDTACSFASLTNMHMYAAIEDLQFALDRIPFAEEHTILYSTNLFPRGGLQYAIASSKEEYLDTVDTEAGRFLSY